MTSIRSTRAFDDVMAIVRIRNEIRTNMTRTQDEIGALEQLQWWHTLPSEIGLYVMEEPTIGIFGYGMLRPLDGVYDALTGAVLPLQQGYGYGRLLFGFLTHEARVRGRTPWLEVLESNSVAKALYEKLGFKISDGHDTPQGPVLVMVHQP